MIYINSFVFATAVTGYDTVTFPFSIDVSGPIDTAGVKWMKFVITSGTHQIQLDSTSSPTKTAIAIFDVSGNLMLSSAAPSPNANLSYFFGAGTYYIAVVAYSGSTVPSYSANWTIIGADNTILNPVVTASGVDLSSLLQHLQVALILDTAQGAVDHNNITLTLV